jgi:hypothetical protein
MDLLLQILQHVWGPVCLAFRPALLHFQPVLVSVGPPDEACLLDLVVQLLVLGALLPLALEASRLRLLEDSLEARRLVLVDVGDHLEDLVSLWFYGTIHKKIMSLTTYIAGFAPPGFPQGGPGGPRKF